MLGAGSLLSPFLNIIFQLFYPDKVHIPNAVLFLIFGICLVLAAYRVWQKEHLERFAQPLVSAKQDLEKLRQHWKKHEETYHKRNVVYNPLAEPPDLSERNKSNFNEYIDKRRLISEAEGGFSKGVERAYEGLPFCESRRFRDFFAHRGYANHHRTISIPHLLERSGRWLVAAAQIPIADSCGTPACQED
jgi:hypothetical protein